MSLLDTASLVVTPNGTKAGKLYSVVPSSGAGDLDVTRATTATRVNSSGLIESVASNVPRLDYTNGSCPSILVEPQRTNIYPYSNQLSQWTKSGTITITENNAISPDGTNNANRVQFTANSNLLFLSGTGLSGSNTLTIYAKAKNGVSAKFRFFANGATLFSSDQTATGEWQRFTFTYSYSALTAGLAGPTTGADDVLFYGFQLEEGSYATSYIPTTSASVTRNADVISKTGISSLIGQTEGTMFLDYNKTHASDEALLGMIYLDANPSNNRLQLVIENNHFYMYASNGGALGLLSGNISLSNGRNKIAVSYGSNGYKIYLNGTSVYTNATTLTPSTDSFRLGSYAGGIAVMSDSINQSSLWKTQLTNTQLAQLTTI